MKTNKISMFLSVILLGMMMFNACKEDKVIDESDLLPIPPETPLYAYTKVNYARLAAIGNETWLLNRKNGGLTRDYTAKEVIAIIEELKPDRLERFISGVIYPDATVPVDLGEAMMTVQQFLNAAIRAGSPDCRIIPELSLQWIPDNENLFWKTASAYKNMLLDRPIRSIYLDGWVAFCEDNNITAEKRSDILKHLREIGYQDIFVDYTGNLEENDPYITGAYLNINPETWRVDDAKLNTLKSYSNISKILVHMDTPETLNQFKLKDADEQANIYCNTIYPNQNSQEINFVFPVMEGTFNSRMIFTGEDYNENSLFEVTRDLIAYGSFQNHEPGPKDPEGPPPPPPPTRAERYVRMIVWAQASGDHWMLRHSFYETANDRSFFNIGRDIYYAEDVIDIIEDLQPTCLERFITGQGNDGPGMKVPTRPGNPEMTFEEFLQKSMDAGAPGCHIVPKLDLTWLGNVKARGDDPMNDETTFWRSARTFYNLDINPPIRTVCLDCWNNFRTNFTTDAERTSILQKLKEIGYTELQLNYTGANGVNNTLIDVAKWNIQTSNWTVNTSALNTFKTWSNLKKYLLYIDYPGAMRSFVEAHTEREGRSVMGAKETPICGTADQMADVLISNIVNREEELGFSFVYPFFQTGYDPSTFITRPEGKYKGKTMYQIQKELLWYGKLLEDGVLVED